SPTVGALAAPPPPVREGDVQGRTVKSPDLDRGERRAVASDAAAKERRDVLFSPRKARPSGDVLEVVAYWGDTVLETELFHPTYKGFEEVTIGDPTKAHLIAAGKDNFTKETF